MLPWAFAESQSTREVRLKTDRSTPPIWLMGMCNATMGFSNGMVLFALPQLLAAEHVPEWQIAAITAVAFSPNFWSVLFAPILDVRFSRRWYATVLASVCAISTAAGVLSLHHLVLLEIAMLVSIAASILSSSAMGGWFSNITAQKHKNILSKWMNISLICGIGVTSMVGGQLVRHLPMYLAATLVGVIVFFPPQSSRLFLLPAQTAVSPAKASLNSIAKSSLFCIVAKS
jgi:PAT family beta-lactamase induction signal transducer AmpG